MSFPMTRKQRQDVACDADESEVNPKDSKRNVSVLREPQPAGRFQTNCDLWPTSALFTLYVDEVVSLQDTIWGQTTGRADGKYILQRASCTRFHCFAQFQSNQRMNPYQVIKGRFCFQKQCLNYIQKSSTTGM